MLDPKLGKGFCAISWIPCAFTACVDQLANYWLPNIDPSSQPRYANVGKIYYNKILKHYINWIII